MPYKDPEVKKQKDREYAAKNREAARKRAKEWYANNTKKAKESRKKWCEENPEKTAAYKRKWDKENKEHKKKLTAEWKKQNPHKVLANTRLRQAKKLKATPNWLTQDHKWMIEEIYELRKLRSEATNVEHHVDHIVPLRGKDVCGLHVPWNLQVITATENLSKSNQF